MSEDGMKMAGINENKTTAPITYSKKSNMSNAFHITVVSLFFDLFPLESTLFILHMRWAST